MIQNIVEPNYPPMPENFQPQLLRRLNVRELLLVVGQFGLLQVAERVGYTEFVEYIRALESTPAAIGSTNGQQATTEA
jgi:hypothetical protein